MNVYDAVFYLPSLGPVISKPEGPVPFGGAETQIWMLAQGLAQSGRTVAVVVSDTPTGVPSRIDGIDIVARPAWEPGGGIRGKVVELVTLWRALGSVDTHVVVQRNAGLWTGLVGGMTRLRRRRFVYSSAHVSDFTFEALPLSTTEIRLFKLGIRLADLIVVQTDEQASLCRERFGRSSFVIKSIAEPADLRAGTPEAFLWIGRLVSYKRPAAFLELARALPEARFRLVGVPAPDQPEIQREVEREAQELPNVELLSTRSRPELLGLYDHAVAVVSTSESEGMPNVFLEGWSRGVPALALSHDPDGVIESWRLGGFARGSRTGLASLAREIWSTKDDQAALSARCRDYVEREHGLATAVARWSAALGLNGARQLPERRSNGAMDAAVTSGVQSAER